MLADRRDRALGAPFRDLWADVWDGVEPFVTQALDGRGTWAEDLPLMMVRNGQLTPTYWTFSYSPLHDDAGKVAGVMNIVTETTSAIHGREALKAEIARADAELSAKVEAQKQQRTLQREMIHRMNNTLAMVQAIVTQTLKSSEDLEGAARSVSARIGALGRANSTLTKDRWESANVEQVVAAALAPHLDRRQRVSLEGPPAMLTAEQAQGMSLAVHELSTNAAKYGALSDEQGLVRVTWSVLPDGDFTFRWEEHTVGVIPSVNKKGFGTRLITRVVPFYFSGKASLKFQGSGVEYVLCGRIGSNFQDGQL